MTVLSIKETARLIHFTLIYFTIQNPRPNHFLIYRNEYWENEEK